MAKHKVMMQIEMEISRPSIKNIHEFFEALEPLLKPFVVSDNVEIKGLKFFHIIPTGKEFQQIK